MSILIKKFRIKSFKDENPIIELKDLTISYGNRQIVENLNLTIQRSEICGLLGPNGAGKSSIYHSIIGLIKPTFGKIFIDGKDASNIPTHSRCTKFGISWVPQYGGSWSDLSVFDNLMASACRRPQCNVRVTGQADARTDWRAGRAEAGAGTVVESK